MPQKHKLGFGDGIIIENDDGTASYKKATEFTQTFRVRIADVTGFSVSKGSAMLERTIRLMGNGTELAAASVPHGTAEKIEEWFRAHPAFGTGGSDSRSASAPSSGSLVADELSKLAALHAQGVLTSEEFAQLKAKLLS